MKDPANPLGPAAPVALPVRPGRRALAHLRSARAPQRRREPQVESVLTEEGAMERLYGERTGTVTASTARPPVHARPSSR